MDTFILILVCFPIYLFFLYIRSKKKQKEIRSKARKDFDDIKQNIEYWMSDKANEEHRLHAKTSQISYDDNLMKITTMPVGFNAASAEVFEYLDEWRLIFQEFDGQTAILDNPVKSKMISDLQLGLNELRNLDIE